jgi:hypothetical protein
VMMARFVTVTGDYERADWTGRMLTTIQMSVRTHERQCFFS